MFLKVFGPDSTVNSITKDLTNRRTLPPTALRLGETCVYLLTYLITYQFNDFICMFCIYDLCNIAKRVQRHCKKVFNEFMGN